MERVYVVVGFGRQGQVNQMVVFNSKEDAEECLKDMSQHSYYVPEIWERCLYDEYDKEEIFNEEYD